MSSPIQLPLPKSFLERILKPVSKITESCILRVDNNILYTLTTSENNSVILCAQTNLGANVGSMRLNILSVRKLLQGLSVLGDDGEFKISIDNNRLICQNINDVGEKTHFTCHLADDKLIKESTISLAKIAALTYDTEFEINTEKTKKIFSAYAYAPELSKIYFYTKDGSVFVDIDDKTQSNIDNISLPIATSYTGKEIKPLAIIVEVFKNLVNLKSNVIVKYNDTNKMFVFTVGEDDVVLKYIVSGLIN